MKKSLGRRSSSRNPMKPSGTEFESARKNRTRIPVRAASADRHLNALVTPLHRGMVTPSIRSASEDRNSMIFSAKGGIERPSRGTTLSTNSARHSSYGGSRSKRDNRPIEDRQWQADTQKKLLEIVCHCHCSRILCGSDPEEELIHLATLCQGSKVESVQVFLGYEDLSEVQKANLENFIMADKEGSQILCNGSIKPITQKLFITIIDLLLRRTFDNSEKTFINQDNYISEFPFYMKKLYYRGKIDKSWLISVNTNRSWCHVLACLDFLVTCVTSQYVIDPDALLFPEKYDMEDEDLWNYQIVLPYLQKSYELYKKEAPDYEHLQEELDNDLIQRHISNNNAFERIESLKSDILKLRRENEEMSKKSEECTNALKEAGGVFNDLKEKKSKIDEYIADLLSRIEEMKIKGESMDNHIKRLAEDLAKKEHLRHELENEVANQQISTVQLAELRNKRDSLQREIDMVNEYVSGLEDLIRKSGLEIICKKKQIQDLIKSFNLEIMKYLPYGLDNVMIDPKQSENEISDILDRPKQIINIAKLELNQLSASNLSDILYQASEELKSWEIQVSEKKTILDKLMKDHSLLLKEKEELIINLKKKLESVIKKGNEISIQTLQEQAAIIKEKKERSEKMEKQLAVYKTNFLKSATECTRILDENIKEHKLLDEEFAKQLEDIKRKFTKYL